MFQKYCKPKIRSLCGNGPLKVSHQKKLYSIIREKNLFPRNITATCYHYWYFFPAMCSKPTIVWRRELGNEANWHSGIVSNMRPLSPCTDKKMPFLSCQKKSIFRHVDTLRDTNQFCILGVSLLVLCVHGELFIVPTIVIKGKCIFRECWELEVLWRFGLRKVLSNWDCWPLKCFNQ